MESCFFLSNEFRGKLVFILDPILITVAIQTMWYADFVVAGIQET